MKKKLRNLHEKAYKKDVLILPIGGIYKYRKTGENHQFQGRLIHTLQFAVGNNSFDTFKKYTSGLNSLPPSNLRDLLEFKKKNRSIELSEVRSIENITKRFGSGSMSHGALSEEARH